MSSHLEQIQALIAEIDGVLQQPSPRLPWMGEASRESRRVLERIRGYLEAQQVQVAAEVSQLARYPSGQLAQPRAPEPENQQAASGQIVQAVAEEIKALRANLMQPLARDMEALQQERDSLVREIRQLEVQRQQQHSLAQQSARQQQVIAEFLQALMGRVQETLTQQVIQTLANIEDQFLTQANYAPPPLEGTPTGGSGEYKPIWDPSDAYGNLRSAPLNPRERLEQLRVLQARADEMLKTLDSTIAVGFEALQRNIQGYEESLSRGIEKMHGLGQQGEILFAHLVSHLAQKLGQEAAGLLQSSIPRAELEPVAAEVAQPPAAPAEKQLPPKEVKNQPAEAPTGEKRPPAASKTAAKKELPPGEKQPTAARAAAASKKNAAAALSRERARNAEGSGDRAPSRSAEKLPVAEVESSLYEAETLELLMNLPAYSGDRTPAAAETTAAPPAGASQEAAEEATDSGADTLLALLAAEWPNPGAESAAQTVALPENPPTAGVENDIAELYANLFGLDEPSDFAQTEREGKDNRRESPSNSAPPTSGFDLFEQALFDGFADPASASAEVVAASKQAEVPPQSLEEFLFTEEPAEPPLVTLDNLFPETTTARVSAESELPASASEELTADLFGDASAGEQLIAPPGAIAKESAIAAQPPEETESVLLEDEWTADSYIPASPEEILLPTAEVQQQERSNLSLDTNTLQQLTNDLSALEGFEDWNVPPSGRSGEKRAPAQPQASRRAEVVKPAAIAPPAPPPAESPAVEDWENITLFDWTSEEEASFAAPTATPLPAKPPQEGESQAIESSEEWLDELNLGTEELPPTAPALPSPPPAIAGTQNLTLDEAFASLTEAIPFGTASLHAEPAEVWNPNPALPVAPNSEAEPTSTLDQLFASMGSETPSAAASEIVVDDFDTPLTNPDIASADSSAEFDELLAELWSDSPTLEDFNPDAEPLAEEAPPESGTAEKKNKIEAADRQAMSDELFPQTSPIRRSPKRFSPPEGEKIWYLGLDVGTSGISAALLNRQSGEVYPIYWTVSEQPTSASPVERSFRLPATAFRSPDSAEWFAPVTENQPAGETALWLSGFKPYLKVGLIGSQVNAEQESNPTPNPWEPLLQWSDRQAIPLSWVQGALQALLATLNPQIGDAEATIAQVVTAEGLNPAVFRAAMGQLAGAVLSYPASWPDSYRFNLSEAVLAAGLVERREQIAFVEEAIAALLSVLPAGDGSPLGLPGSSLSQQLNFFNAHSPGATLVICSGATATELAIANIPETLSELSYSDLAFRSIPYAGDAIDQDILCQMLLSPPEKNLNYEENLQASDLILHAAENWPRAGEPDLEKRYRLQQLCRASSIAPSLLETVQYMKVALQYRERLALEVGSRRLVVSRRDLESRVFLPFVQRLNRELNALLSQTGVPVQGINRAICTGGTASVSAIARWLRQKLPNATIVQDTYPSDRPPACSRVAYGLAAVPLHPRVIDIYRQQYSDAFVLAEILRTVRDRPLSLPEILRLLERRGINTSACRQRIESWLEGHLPAFLQPAEADRVLLSDEFKENPDYLALSATPLFSKEQQGYRINPRQFHRLRQYFSHLIARCYQRLDEPLMVELAQRIGNRR